MSSFMSSVKNFRNRSNTSISSVSNPFTKSSSSSDSSFSKSSGIFESSSSNSKNTSNSPNHSKKIDSISDFMSILSDFHDDRSSIINSDSNIHDSNDSHDSHSHHHHIPPHHHHSHDSSTSSDSSVSFRLKDEKRRNKPLKNEPQTRQQKPQKPQKRFIPDDEMLEMERDEMVGFFDQCMSNNRFLFDPDDKNKKVTSNDKLAAETASFVFSRLAGTGIGAALISTGFLSWLGIIVLIFANTPKSLKNSFKKYLSDETLLGYLYDFEKIKNPTDKMAEYVDDIDSKKSRYMKMRQDIIKRVEELKKEKEKEDQEKEQNGNKQQISEDMKNNFAKNAEGIAKDVVNVMDQAEKKQDFEKDFEKNNKNFMQEIEELKQPIIKKEGDSSKTNSYVEQVEEENEVHIAKEIYKIINNNSTKIQDKHIDFLKKTDLGAFKIIDKKEVLDRQKTKENMLKAYGNLVNSSKSKAY